MYMEVVLYSHQCRFQMVCTFKIPTLIFRDYLVTFGIFNPLCPTLSDRTEIKVPSGTVVVTLIKKTFFNHDI